jgi:hypothetical protein
MEPLPVYAAAQEHSYVLETLLQKQMNAGSNERWSVAGTVQPLQ